jgi:hypothetical protein
LLFATDAAAAYAYFCLRFRSARHLRLAAAAYSVGALALIEQLWKPREHES